MRQQGRLASWNDAKGFGFISPDDGSADVFLHIKSLETRSARPAVGAVLSFETARDEKKRMRAVRARLVSGGSSAGPGGWLATTFALSFLALLAAAAAAGRIDRTIPVTYALVSVFTFIIYGLDKAQAQRGGWRTSEAMLHGLSFLGGWPGALIAQQRLRHKTRKLGFQGIFWLTALGHLSFWIWLGLDRAGVALF